jgi:hypothetical protein
MVSPPDLLHNVTRLDLVVGMMFVGCVSTFLPCAVESFDLGFLMEWINGAFPFIVGFW